MSLSNAALDAMVAAGMSAKMFAEVIKADRENSLVFLYIIGPVGGKPPFKIGISRNPFERLSSIQNGCPGKVTVLYTLPAGGRNFALQLERKVHEFLDEYRGIGEWFNIYFNDEPNESLRHTIEGIWSVITEEVREREEDIETEGWRRGYRCAELNAHSYALLSQ